MKRILPLAAGLLLLAGCSAPESGLVYDKHYEPAYIYTDTICSSYNKQGICVLRLPMVHEVPERWRLCLRNGDDEGCRYVDQLTYHHYKIGSQYP